VKTLVSMKIMSWDGTPVAHMHQWRTPRELASDVGVHGRSCVSCSLRQPPAARRRCGALFLARPGKNIGGVPDGKAFVVLG
jgi:hypothetical protein